MTCFSDFYLCGEKTKIQNFFQLTGKVGIPTKVGKVASLLTSHSPARIILFSQSVRLFPILFGVAECGPLIRIQNQILTGKIYESSKKPVDL